MNEPFNVVEKVINSGATLHIVEINSLTTELKSCIDQHITKIHSNNEFDITGVKRKIFKHLKSKSDSSLEMGDIAEFFIHLFLNEKQYKQECLYSNLEENSAKKGFDGYYSKNGKEWIMESKSGNITTTGISHKTKINDAYKDLRNKVSGSGNVTNNPWTNAFNHAKAADSNQPIKDNLKKLSIEFDEGIFLNIRDLNVIPSSTIFLNNQQNTLSDIKQDITTWLNGKEYKNIHIVCITQTTKDVFLSYLSS